MTSYQFITTLYLTAHFSPADIKLRCHFTHLTFADTGCTAVHPAPPYTRLGFAFVLKYTVQLFVLFALLLLYVIPLLIRSYIMLLSDDAFPEFVHVSAYDIDEPGIGWPLVPPSDTCSTRFVIERTGNDTPTTFITK
jgi:hypothetical protein